jgi:hypothetical protein
VQSLLNPTQMRRNGLIVDNVARKDNPDSTHSIFVKENNLRILFSLRGVMSGFTICLPTMDEYTSLPQIVMTSDSPWEPQSRSHEEAKAVVTGSEYHTYNEYHPHELDSNHRLLRALESKHDEDSGTDYPEFMDDERIYERLILQVVSAPDDVPGNGLSGHTAKCTMHVTTQAGLRNVFMPG